MNQVATQQQAADPWGAYADTVKTGNNNVFLRYKLGKYLYGQDNTEMPLDTILIVNMSTMETGHQRWDKGQPAQKSFVLIENGFAPTPRAQLGYTDESDWEDDTSSGKIEYVPVLDDNGNVINGEDGNPVVKVKKKDPWQEQTKVVCVGEDGVQYEFSSGSKGGMGALGSLCQAYGKEARNHPNDHPKVKIGTGSYFNKHTKADVLFPTFEIVGWIDKNESADTSANAATNTTPAAQIEQQAATVETAPDNFDMDEEIPF